MKLIGKMIVCTLTLVLATIVGGAIVSALRLTPPTAPWSTSPGIAVAWMAVGSLVLIIGMVPIASGLGGHFPTRYLALAWLLIIANAVNTVLELTIFSTLGGQVFMLTQFVIAFGITAAVLARMFGSTEAASAFPHMNAGSWTWRVLLAWLAFPVIYFLFGMCVGPFVVDTYRAGAFGLRIPPMDILLRTLALRSLLFLAATLPVIRLWTGSRRGLIFALGLAHAAMVGLYGLSQAYWLPPVLRTLHSVEIVADSFVYAFVLAMLFFPSTRAAVDRVAPGAVTSTSAA